jgi:hypothetical protein
MFLYCTLELPRLAPLDTKPLARQPAHLRQRGDRAAIAYSDDLSLFAIYSVLAGFTVLLLSRPASGNFQRRLVA